MVSGTIGPRRTGDMQTAEGSSESLVLTQEEADILAKTQRILGNAERGLTVTEIAQLLNLQPTSVRIYLRNDKRRIDLYRRLFEQDEAVKVRAIGILEIRRSE
jgi:DNA-binding CsgD family transcriptional regulator